MQPVMAPPNSGKIALREGAIVAAFLVVAHTILGALNSFVHVPFLPLFLILLIVVVWIVAFLFAGIRGSKATGRVSTGTLAGLWTGIIAGVLALIVNVLFAALTTSPEMVNNAQSILDQMMPSNHVTYTVGMFVGISALYNTCLLLFGIGIGAGVGALGGLIGRNRSPFRPVTVYGYAPQAPYPPQGTYPPPPPPVYPPNTYPSNPPSSPNPPNPPIQPQE